ncbi:MAG: hypothetical protein K9H49_19705 [Bacteroidales bacterium]|nr:hypothetical protein [Bacteroidales bacterium]MCF8392023.1 hypothetical protein [Bacteroidales bacterium]
MKSIIVFFTFLFISLSLSAQYTVLSASDLVNDYSGQIRNSIDKKDLSIEGNPYVFEDFISGIVYPKNDDRAFHVNLNVNAYTNLFELKFEDRVYEMPNYAFDSVNVAGSTFIPVSVFKNEMVTFYTMEVLARDGKGNFLVQQHIIHLLEATSAKAYHMASPAKYQSYPNNYFIFESEDRNLYPLRRVKSLTQIEKYSKDLSVFLKENRIRNRSISDLQKLFYFLYPGSK